MDGLDDFFLVKWKNKMTIYITSASCSSEFPLCRFLFLGFSFKLKYLLKWADQFFPAFPLPSPPPSWMSLPTNFTIQYHTGCQFFKLYSSTSEKHQNGEEVILNF